MNEDWLNELFDEDPEIAKAEVSQAEVQRKRDKEFFAKVAAGTTAGMRLSPDDGLRSDPYDKRANAQSRKALNEVPPKEFKYTAFEDIAFDTEEEWLVKKLLPLTGVAALYGPSGGYKSFLLFDLSLHVALGWPWAGRRVKQADVVYIAAEGAGGFKKRKAGWLKEREGVPSKVPFYLQTVAPNLGGAKHDLQTLIDSVGKAELKPGVICIDTLAQSLGGGDENSAGMAQFVSNATALAIHFKCLVIVVHHVGLSDDERLRGSTNLIGGLDASIHCARNEGTLSALLKVKKLKDEDVDQI